MKDFIQNLYSNPNFPLYLGIVIVVLLITFFVVYMLGKKDKEKLEETKRLETVTSDAFSEVSVPTSVEAPKVEPIVSQENGPTVEKIEKDIPKEPVKEEVLEPVINDNIAIPETNSINNEPKVSTPTSNPEPSVIPDIIKLPDEDEGYKATPVKYDEITKSIDKDLKEMENKMVKPVLNEEAQPPISIPKVENVSEPIETKKVEVVNEVFSSVYPPKKEPVMFDDTMEIELPRLK